MLPFAVNTLLEKLNLRLSLAPALPLSLYNTAVFDPGTTMLPLMLPITLPRNQGAVTLPVLRHWHYHTLKLVLHLRHPQNTVLLSYLMIHLPFFLPYLILY